MTERPVMSAGALLVRYESACRALAEARTIDEAKEILDLAVAMACYARQAKNRDAEADAVAIRMRATRRLDQLRQAQKQTVGLAKGGEQYHGTGVSKTPVVPTLAMQGIDKNLARQARTLGALSDESFEAVVAETRDKVGRAVRNAVREVEITQGRASFQERIEHGCTVDDLVALAESGKRFTVLYADPPWPWGTFGPLGRIRSCADHHYLLATLGEIKALPIAPLAADDCTLLVWGTWPRLPDVLDVISAWGFQYKTAGFVWIKESGSGVLHTGMGYHTRSNSEFCLLATKGAPLRLARDVHQVVSAPVGEHSEKPEEVRRRIERLFSGPFLELYARKPAPGWTVWGNEIPRAQFLEAAE